MTQIKTYQVRNLITLINTTISGSHAVTAAAAASHTHANKTTLDSISSSGTGSQFLADDGQYKLLSLSISGIEGMSVTGTGDKYLADDGTYKELLVSYSNSATTPTTIGGIPSGSSFSNKTITEMFDALLYPYQNPGFSSFNYSISQPLEVGTTISGFKNFVWATSNSSNVSPNSLTIKDFTNNVILASGLANDGSESLDIGTVLHNTASSHTWKISGVNTNAITFERDFTVGWRWRIFYGESVADITTAPPVSGLRVTALVDDAPGTYSFLGGGYKYICYPTSFGILTTFKDQSTGLDVPFQQRILSITNANGVTTNYYIHRSTNILGASINIIVN